MRRPTAIEKLAIGLAARSPGSYPNLRAEIEATFPGAIERERARIEKERFDRKFVGPVPDWVKRYVKKHARGRVSMLTVRQSRTKFYSSGHCQFWDGSIVVTFGAGKTEADEIERKATVLHEIAHALSPTGHDERFYVEWRRLLAAEGILRATIATGRFGDLRAAKLRRAAQRR